jgi:sugar phosphate permease
VGLLQVAGRVLLFVSERHWDLHRVNRVVPCLVPLGLLLLLIAPWAGAAQFAVVAAFVAVYGMGNGMFTIVKGTAIAEYVDHHHAASLNGALGLPTALARAASPWLLGMMWSPAWGYTAGVAALLLTSVVAIVALIVAQRTAQA